MKSLNIIQHPGDEKGERKIYSWSGMVGGKAVEETLQCLEHSFQKRCVGAERCFLNCDGALISYAILQAFAWFVHPKNQKRYFTAINLLSPETGHSRLEADTINKQVNDHYSKKERFATCSDRVEFINKETNIEMMEWKYFATLPKLYQRIFKDSSTWKDQYGNSAGIRGDKGMVYEFGQSKVWNDELKQFEWIDHYKELWIRCDEDLKQSCRKINIFNNNIDDLSSQYLESLRKQKSRKKHPIIPREALNGTLDIAKMFPTKDDLVRYYAPSSVDESGEIKEYSYETNHEKIRVKMQRRQQMIKMIRENKTIKLAPYKKRTKRQDSCDCHETHTHEALKKMTCHLLRQELRKHHRNPKGKKLEMIQTLKVHYELFHSIQDL